MGATLINYPLTDVISVFKVTKNAFRVKSYQPLSLIPKMVDFAKKARREGILSFEANSKKSMTRFWRAACRWPLTEWNPNPSKRLLNTEIDVAGGTAPVRR